MDIKNKKIKKGLAWVSRCTTRAEPKSHHFLDSSLIAAILPDVTNQFNEFVAEEVGSELRHMTEHRTNSKESGGAIQVFQVPVQKGEHKAISKPHEPGHEKHGAILDTAQQFN